MTAHQGISRRESETSTRSKCRCITTIYTCGHTFWEYVTTGVPCTDSVIHRSTIYRFFKSVRIGSVCPTCFLERRDIAEEVSRMKSHRVLEWLRNIREAGTPGTQSEADLDPV